MSLVVGENVGPYRIVEQLGQGGMATVFKGYHAALDRYVAIKVLHPAFKEDPTFLARFQREARVVAKLEHPHIVPVYDFAEHNGAPYLVMKFIEGETLKARLARGPLTLKETQRILDAVGAGLDHAHQQGILHRDIKSSNIMLAGDGAQGIYLADFGLARIAIAGESTLSMDSMIGTPHYMSPEQAKGVKDLDAGTDIYSLGVVLYELVEGRLPYSADTPFAIIHDHIYTPLPVPHLVNQNVPEAIERVLLRALAKERADRYPDVAAMVMAFREAVAGAESGVIALPTGVPVSPSAPTASPSASTRIANDAPATAEPTMVASKPAVKKGYQFKWWHAVAGVAAVVLCLIVAGAVARNANRQRNPTPAPTVAAINNPSPIPPNATPQGQPPPGTPQGQPSAVPGTLPPTPDQHTPLPPPPGGAQGEPPWKASIDKAASLFQSGAAQEAVQTLNDAVTANVHDPGFYLAAGDLALSHDLPVDALSHFYLPGRQLDPESRDGVFVELREHGLLAFYVAASFPDAEKFLLDIGPTIQDNSANLAYQRWRLFHGDAETARVEVETIVKSSPASDAPQLIYGDYFLKVGKPGEAMAHYEAATRNPPGQRLPMAWVKREAECRQRVLLEQKSNAQLSPTCEPLPVLLQRPLTP